jgi:hypothetical protein
MSLLAALPLVIKPDAKTFANIGWGSGLSAQTLLSHSGPQVLDSIEIEPAMYAGARSFAPRVTRPYSDPRSHVHFEDAKSTSPATESSTTSSFPSPPTPGSAASRAFSQPSSTGRRVAISHREACSFSGCRATSSTTGS